MADVEKVIKEYEDYVNYFKPYCIGDVEDHAMLKDVLALLKEQQTEIEDLRTAMQSMIEGYCVVHGSKQPKTGHWEVLTMCANEGTYCSVCHTKIFDFVHPPKKKLSRFCPHCGAKMDF